MKTESQSKVMLITGTSRGIGKMLAEHYCEKGWMVIGCSRGESEIRHSSYLHQVADLEKEEDIISLFKTIRSQYGQLDAVINNAAVNPAIVSAALLPASTIKHAYAVNVFAVMIICREAVKLMSRKKQGRIINIGSMASKLEVQGESVYTSTKAAVVSYSRVLAKESYKAGITVNVVAPSVVESDLSSKINKEKLQEVLERNAINHWGSMTDISAAIDFLIAEESNAVTGQIIYLGGV